MSDRSSAAAAALLAALAIISWPGGGAWRRRAARQVTSGTRAAATLPAPSRAPARRDRRDVEVVASSLDLLALALRGGIGIVEAIESVAAVQLGEAARQLGMVSAALRWGLSEGEAWAAVAPVWEPAAQALSLSGRAGLAPADLLVRAAADLREAEVQRLELATSRLGVRLVLPLGLVFLPAFVLTTVVPLVLALARQALVP